MINYKKHVCIRYTAQVCEIIPLILNGGYFFKFYRNVNRIVLMKGGGMVKVVTHTPLGGTRSITTHVGNISSIGSRLGMYWSITGVFKTTQPPQTKFTACCLQWTAVNPTKILFGYV